ncbi:MAG TPA: SNF2-related protein [Streptosporangiaceae bacterium]
MRVELLGLEPDALADIVGEECHELALRYVRDGAVTQQVWVAEQNALCGIVRGRHGGFYTPVVYFTSGARVTVSGAQCSCTSRYGCEHAAALLLSTTRDADGRDTNGRDTNGRAAWERSLEELLTASDGTASDSVASYGARADTPLAVELSLDGQHLNEQRLNGQRDAQPSLMARLVQPGKNGGWIYGSLSWAKLDNYDYHGGYRRSHVRLLREMLALHRTHVNQSYYYYSYGDERQIELSAFESPRLWPLLDEARNAGLQLLRAGRREPMDQHREAELCLDVTGCDALLIAPVIRLAGDDRPVAVLRFIGAEGHGVVYADSAGRFQLARLARPGQPGQPGRPVADSIQRLALSGGHLQVPDSEAFRTRYYPRLRRTATLISSDGSFAPPEISEPTLVVQASYGDDHDVELGWEWLYQVGGNEFRLPLNAGQEGSDYRDPAAERAMLASLPSGPGQGTLNGLDTMRFTTELLPLLRSQPGVAVEVSGTPADYREAAARIGVSTDERAGDTDWFDLGVTITVEDRDVPFTEVFKALSRGDTHLLLADGAYFSLEKPELQALRKLIEEARALQDKQDGPLKISRFQVSLWDELAALGVVSRQAKAWSEGLLSLRHAPGHEQPEPPRAINALLRPYQLDGFQWLAFLWRHRLGGILADDMGLGKTLQTLTLISHAKASRPFIIVAPTSVVPNWAAEAAKFAPDLTVKTITSRAQRIGELARTADAIVTSYTLLRLDFEEYADLEWSGLILDEAQSVKNHQSQVYQCARKLPAPFKVAITGTPMENNLMELWSLLSITAPGLFPHPARFKEYYVQPIEKKGDTELLAQLKRRIRPLIMRRTKEQVAKDLPPKQEQILEVELHPKHRKIYQTHLQRERQKVLGLLGDLNANRFTILRSLTLLRQLSLHPALIDTVHGDVPSAKIDTLIDQIRDVVAGGHRALVFSQFTGFLTHVRIRLAAAGIKYCYLDGSTRNRGGVLTEFKGGAAPVFLISLKAGGFGLNLTEADYCFLLDPWWNPATEAQAVDRTHRIGQTRTVMVYRLIAKDTIEEKVVALQARKAELFASVMDEGNTFGSRLTAEDVQNLFE